MWVCVCVYGVRTTRWWARGTSRCVAWCVCIHIHACRDCYCVLLRPSNPSPYPTPKQNNPKTGPRAPPGPCTVRLRRRSLGRGLRLGGPVVQARAVLPRGRRPVGGSISGEGGGGGYGRLCLCVHSFTASTNPSIRHTATSSAASPWCWARRGCWPAATATASRSTARFGACARVWVFLFTIRERRDQTFLFVWLSLTPTQANISPPKKTQDATPPANALALLQAQEQDPHPQSTTQQQQQQQQQWWCGGCVAFGAGGAAGPLGPSCQRGERRPVLA